MHLQASAERGALYRLDHRGLSQMIPGVTISNGICWTADAQTMYYIDSPLQQVRAYDFHDASGEITNERVVITVDPGIGTPDGMTIDEEGNLWVALWGGAAVGKWNPVTGALIDKIEVPALNVTSCAFGGADLSTLYITSASIDMTDEQATDYPDAGSLFMIKTKSRGLLSSFYQF